MLNIISTPPSRAPRLPSLEPYQPKSGTTGVPAASLARLRRIPRRPSPLPESSSEEECEHKLDALIGCMEDVLKGYAGYTSRAPTYLAALHDFHQRALNLKAPQMDTPSPTESASGESPEGYFPPRALAYIPGHSPTHPNQPRHTPRPVHSTSPISPTTTPPADQLKTPRSPQPQSPSPPIQQVRMLAREWWGSEVAAAWYGPRPRARPSHSPTSRRRKHSAEEERERLRVSLEELEVKSTGHLERDVRKDKMEKDREQSIKRESSFVGLYDE